MLRNKGTYSLSHHNKNNDDYTNSYWYSENYSNSNNTMLKVFGNSFL
jgi:hypothetical protein